MVKYEGEEVNRRSSKIVSDTSSHFNSVFTINHKNPFLFNLFHTNFIILSPTNSGDNFYFEFDYSNKSSKDLSTIWYVDDFNLWIKLPLVLFRNIKTWVLAF